MNSQLYSVIKKAFYHCFSFQQVKSHCSGAFRVSLLLGQLLRQTFGHFFYLLTRCLQNVFWYSYVVEALLPNTQTLSKKIPITCIGIKIVFSLSSGGNYTFQVNGWASSLVLIQIQLTSSGNIFLLITVSAGQCPL